jgi:hypothetical protein
MLNTRPAILKRGLMLLTGLLILKVTGSVVLQYRDYFPPNFQSDFLRGREAYFQRSYQWAFYVHLAGGPLALVLGLVLVSERFRLRFPKWHRRLGRIQAVAVLFVVAPSGLWMARHAQAGPIAGLGFFVLALLTGATVAMGWRAAMQRRFGVHRRWMWRCYLLLCSTVVLRLTAGLATVTGVDSTWIDPFIAWASWLVPLAAFELNGIVHRQLRRMPSLHETSEVLRTDQKSPIFSPPATEISARRVAAGVPFERNRIAPSHKRTCEPPV